METAFTFIRLTVVLYFIPFFFVYNPAVISMETIIETAYLFALYLFDIWIVFQDWRATFSRKLGRLRLWECPLFVAAGFMIALPGWIITITIAALAALVIAIIFKGRKPGGSEANNCRLKLTELR